MNRIAHLIEKAYGVGLCYCNAVSPVKPDISVMVRVECHVFVHIVNKNPREHTVLTEPCYVIIARTLRVHIFYLA